MSQFLYEPGLLRRIWLELEALKSLVNAVITSNAEIRSVGGGGTMAGVIATHPHTGTGEGGVLELSSVFSFVSSADAAALSGGVIQLPAAPFGLIFVISQAGVDDDLDDIEINGGGTTLVPGTLIYLTNLFGDVITVKHDGAKIDLQFDVDVVLSDSGMDWICLQAISTSLWREFWRSPSLMPVLSRAIADPGNGNAIPVTASGYVALVTGGAETRTLAAPTFVGQEIVLYMKTNGGNCTVTCTTTINETGNNTIIFANTGEAVRLFAVEEGATIRWRMAVADGAGLSTV